MEEFLKENWLLFIPIIAINYIMVVVALVDLVRREKVTGGSKWIWAPIILFLQYLGPILYFVVGRKE